MRAELSTPKHVQLDSASFNWISRVVYERTGIVLGQGKQELVKARLAKRMRATRIDSVKDYIKYIKEDPTGSEMRELLDAITTNKTSFFREPDHFDYLRDAILPELKSRYKAIRIWSAGCSTGEEPYTISMVLHEAFPDIHSADVKILATDIANTVLAEARSGEYTFDKVKEVPKPYLTKYFTTIQGVNETIWRIAPSVRKIVYFARLNLMEEWPMKGPFQVIFCRNVMIYFDRPTRERLVNRFYDYLCPGGYLLVGHSECLSLSTSHNNYVYVRPGIYRKS